MLEEFFMLLPQLDTPKKGEHITQKRRATFKQMQQLLGQKCWESLRPFPWL